MENEIKVGLHNRFDIIKRDAKTGEVLGQWKAENILLNQFWSRFLSGNNATCLNYIRFGSGTATPIATDTSLTTDIAGKSSTIVSTDTSTYETDKTIKIKRTIRLQDTEYVGSVISEVGFAHGDAAFFLMTKALVKDMNGNPVSIEKKAGEVLDIFATFYVNFGSDFDNGNIHLLFNPAYSNPVLFQTAWASSPGYYLKGRYQRHRTCASISAYTATALGIAYDVANKKLTYSINNVTSANGNVAGGFRGLEIGVVQMNLPCAGFTQPVLTKEVVATGDGVTKDFQTAFGYILNNGTAKVYVNDIEDATAVIDFGMPLPKTNIIHDMLVLSGTDCTLGGNHPTSSATYVIAENPFYNTLPIVSATGAYGAYVEASNDLTNWTTVCSWGAVSSRDMAIAAQYQNYRYWRINVTTNGASAVTALNSTVAASLKNIHLTSAPASGATVAVTYQPDCIAKDVNHVLNNVSTSITFNEYTPT